MNTPRAIIVVWLDTQTSIGWHTASSDLHPATVLTVGWLIDEDEQYFKVSSSWNNGLFADATVILKGTVVFYKVLVLPNLKKWME